MSASTLELKSKYQDSWEHSNKRESVAEKWLDLLGIKVEPTGLGVNSTELFSRFHHGALEKFDYLAPDLGLLFEVTGTGWTQADSARRCSVPMLPVLKAKVDWANYYGLEKYVVFVGIWDVEGNIRFMPCQDAINFPLFKDYAKNEGDYFGIPWESWLTPRRFLKLKNITPEART